MGGARVSGKLSDGPLERYFETGAKPVSAPEAAQLTSSLKTPPSKAAKPHHHGHRDRLRKRFAENGAQALADYELLELYLFRSIARRDTKPIAKDLISRFGSFAEVVSAPVHRLTETKYVSENVALDLKVLAAAAVKLGQESLLGRPILSSWNALLDYCRSAMQFEGIEQFRVLFLDRKNRLIADEILGKGTVDRAPVYPREIMKRALDLEATALILCHNHPSGDPTPSQSDIDMTNHIISAAKPLSIAVHDHLIIGRENIASFKTLGLM
jgi:DNA repair protein RadC